MDTTNHKNTSKTHQRNKTSLLRWRPTKTQPSGRESHKHWPNLCSSHAILKFVEEFEAIPPHKGLVNGDLLWKMRQMFLVLDMASSVIFDFPRQVRFWKPRWFPFSLPFQSRSSPCFLHKFALYPTSQRTQRTSISSSRCKFIVRCTTGSYQRLGSVWWMISNPSVNWNQSPKLRFLRFPFGWVPDHKPQPLIQPLKSDVYTGVRRFHPVSSISLQLTTTISSKLLEQRPTGRWHADRITSFLLHQTYTKKNPCVINRLSWFPRFPSR